MGDPSTLEASSDFEDWVRCANEGGFIVNSAFDLINGGDRIVAAERADEMVDGGEESDKFAEAKWSSDVAMLALFSSCVKATGVLPSKVIRDVMLGEGGGE